MEEILSNLLVPDNEVIQKATAQLKEAFKNPAAISELGNVMRTSPVVQNRQYAALLLRKKLGKTNIWKGLAPESRFQIRQGCLEALVNEPEKPVAQAIARLVATLAKHQGEPWPDIFQFLSSGAPRAAYTMSVLSESAYEILKPNLQHFLNIFGAALQNGSDPETAYYTILTLTHMVPHIGSEEAKSFGALVPHVVNVTRHLVTADEDKAADAMDIFEELFETEVPVVGAYIESIFEMCLSIAADSNLGDALRAKAISWLGRVSKLKRKLVANKKMLVPMLDTLFKVICEMPDVDDDEAFETAESNSPSVVAAQTLDTVAIHLPPEKFMPVLIAHVQPALTSNDPAKLRGAFYSMAVIAEGCSENIKRKYLVNFLHCIDGGIKHDVPAVRNSALYALGQFSDYMQPDISNYADTILPVLFNYFDSSMAQLEGQLQMKKSPSLDRIFYALEVYCENLEEKLVPMLPELIQRLLKVVTGNFPVRAKELSVSCIGSATSAVKEDIIPYFDSIMEPLKSFLVYDETNPDTVVMFNQSLDTLASLARAVGVASFAPKLAEECCNLALSLVEKHDDPDVRKCSYNLFSAVSYLVKDEMSSVLPNIIPMLIVSVSSKDGISLEFKDDDEDESGLNLDEISDEDDEISLTSDMSASENVKAINVENAYMEEKESAIIALKEICQNSGQVFEPYLQKVTEEVLKLTDFPDPDVKRSVVAALAQFAVSFYKCNNQAKFEELAKVLVPVIVRCVKEDEEASVVCGCLDSLAELLKNCKNGVTQIAGITDLIVSCITDVMKSNCACMDNEADDDDEEGQEAEQDELIYECAGDVIPNLGRAMDPASFNVYFSNLAPMLLKKTGKNCTPAEKSFGVGSMAECLESLVGHLDPYVGSLVNMFLSLTRDEDEDVRNNAVFGAGELALHGGQAVIPHYRQIMQTLSKMLSSGEKHPRVLDQIVGCLCRLILANKASVPLDNVLTVIFQNLPLREDIRENEVVFKTMQILYTDSNPMVKTNMGKIVATGVRVLTQKEMDEKLPHLVLTTLKQFSVGLAPEFGAAVGLLAPADQEKLMIALSKY